MVALVIGTHDHVDAFLDGHKGFVFDEKTGRLRELRLATATETAVEMVPSAELQAEEQSSPQAAPPLFADFSEEMLLRLGVPQKDFGVLRSLTDPNSRAMPCPALSEKIFWFSEAANQFYIRSHPVPHRGALRNVTNAGRDAMDADGAPDVSTGRGRRRRVVLMPRRWHQVGGNIRK
jgi:hypothetical protein